LGRRLLDHNLSGLDDLRLLHPTTWPCTCTTWGCTTMATGCCSIVRDNRTLAREEPVELL